MPAKKAKQSKKKDSVLEEISYDDPLDQYGEKDNFITGQSYSGEYREKAEKWGKLPLYQHKEQIKNFFESLENNQVTLVISGTGSGKTVLIPKFALKYLLLKNRKTETGTETETETVDTVTSNSKIIITNPKILTTISNAEYSAATLDVPLGNHVGYKFRNSPENMASEDTKLLYATDGLLLTQLLKNKLLPEYNAVIIDEVHERQVPIDLLLYFLKDVLKKRPEFKLIIMSATIDANIFKTFYEKDDITFGHISITGQSNHPIESIWMAPHDKINMFNYIDIGISIILKLLEDEVKGDILMFVTSQKDTEIGCSKLKALCNRQIKDTRICDEFYCAEVYGKMSDTNRELAVAKDKYRALDSRYKRKIIFATNVVESSLTVDGIVYVIDSGLELLSYFDYNKYINVIEKRYTTQAQIKQRMGRTGRLQKGICYHLYTQDTFNKLDKYPSPSIVLTNMNGHFLSFMRYHTYISDVIELCKNLISPIKPIQIMSAARYLHFNNLIKLVKLNADQNGGDDEGMAFEFGESEAKKYDDAEIAAENEIDKIGRLYYSDIQYGKMTTYESWLPYQGTLTRFGKVVHDLSNYSVELAMLAFYGRMLNLPMIYSMVGIIAAMDNKLDNLIRFPSTNPQDRMAFINANFADAIVNYSDHMFLYNLLTNYYEMGKNLELLNLSYFENVNEIKNTFAKVLDRIADADLISINQKYNLIPDELLAETDNMSIYDRIYLALYLTYRYNLLKYVTSSNNKVEYETRNHLDNINVNINFSFGNTLAADDAIMHKWAICNGITNVTGKIFVNGCTLIPNEIGDKFISYYI
jgi:superfamily II DNA/RNA helicase